MRIGHVQTAEAAGLATRMANHFGHKVAVERDADATRIHTRFGLIELVAAADELRVRVDGDDDARLAEIAQSHLERFAREPFELVWA